ncbi:MAG: hypothetical protein WD059_04095 [Balneolaceae bacterium]
MTREECYIKISTTVLLYNELNEKWEKEFIKSLKKSSVKLLIQYPPQRLGMLMSYEKFEKYFAYHPDDGSKQLHFIEKTTVSKMFKNVKFCYKRQLESDVIKMS